MKRFASHYPNLLRLLGDTVVQTLEQHRAVYLNSQFIRNHIENCPVWPWCGRNLGLNGDRDLESIEYGLTNVAKCIDEDSWRNQWHKMTKCPDGIASLLMELTIANRLSEAEVLDSIEEHVTRKDYKPDFLAQISKRNVYFEATFYTARRFWDRAREQAEQNNGLFGGISDGLSSPELRKLHGTPENQPIVRKGPEPEHHNIVGALENKAKKFTGSEIGIIAISGPMNIDRWDIESALFGGQYALLSNIKNPDEESHNSAYRIVAPRTFYHSDKSKLVYGVLYIAERDTNDLKQRFRRSLNEEFVSLPHIFYPNLSNREIEPELCNAIAGIFDAKIGVPHQLV